MWYLGYGGLPYFHNTTLCIPHPGSYNHFWAWAFPTLPQGGPLSFLRHTIPHPGHLCHLSHTALTPWGPCLDGHINRIHIVCACHPPLDTDTHLHCHISPSKGRLSLPFHKRGNGLHGKFFSWPRVSEWSEVAELLWATEPVCLW